MRPPSDLNTRHYNYITEYFYAYKHCEQFDGFYVSDQMHSINML